MNEFLFSFGTGIKTGLKEIRMNMGRSFLTLSGVILGVASVVIMLSVFKGFDEKLSRDFAVWGGESRIFIMNSVRDRDESERIQKKNAPVLNESDIRALEDNLDFITAVYPEKTHSGKAVSRFGETRIRVQGVREGHMEAFTNYADEGRSIRTEDVTNMNQIIVIGTEIRDRLFGKDVDALGESILFKGHVFVVAGIIQKFERWSRDGKRNYWGFRNRSAFIPISVARRKLMPKDMNIENVNIFSDGNPQKIDDYITKISDLLKRLHGGVENFRVRANYQWYERAEEEKNSFATVFVSIASISLIVGAIGIFNIMLASINSRIREIGIRKSSGAAFSDLFIQFLTESVLLSFIGSIFGLVLAAAANGIIAPFLEESIGASPVMSLPIIFLGLFVSLLTGIISGLYPALKAASYNPVQALSYS
ncbi:MAG: ABC transporter permease [Fibrobacterota bacterium]